MKPANELLNILLNIDETVSLEEIGQGKDFVVFRVTKAH